MSAVLEASSSDVCPSLAKGQGGVGLHARLVVDEAHHCVAVRDGAVCRGHRLFKKGCKKILRAVADVSMQSKRNSPVENESNTLML